MKYLVSIFICASCCASEWWSHSFPFLAITGDSIAEGHNTSSQYHSDQHGGPSGNLFATIPYLMSLFANTNTFTWTNHAKGSQTWAWVDSTGIGACDVEESSCIVLLCGVNDVATGRTWDDVNANLISIKSKVTHNQRVFLSEILPWTAGGNTAAATIRTWNTNYANWCATNGWYLLSCHDAMGQTRPSTGYLDDMNTIYNQDGVHLTALGVEAIGLMFYNQMLNVYQTKVNRISLGTVRITNIR